MAGTDLQSLLIGFFASHPSPSIEDVKQFAVDNGTEIDVVNKEIYNLISSFSIGKHNDVPDSSFDPTELAMGIEVEMEHTDNRAVAILIAKDHLSEIPDYYSRLKAMEEEGKANIKSSVKHALTASVISLDVDTRSLMDALIGKIRHYYRRGSMFEHANGYDYIDGLDLLEANLEPLVEDFDIGGQKTKITISNKVVSEFLSDIDDPIGEFKADPVGVLQAMKNSSGFDIDPRDYSRKL